MIWGLKASSVACTSFIEVDKWIAVIERKKKLNFFSCKFVQLLVIRTPDPVLGPDPDRYSVKMLDPNSMNPDPKHWKLRIWISCLFYLPIPSDFSERPLKCAGVKCPVLPRRFSSRMQKRNGASLSLFLVFKETVAWGGFLAEINLSWIERELFFNHLNGL